MVLITVELVRKRAEHHDRELAPLEEIALHQENIERLEHLQHWCPKLRILLLQANLIPRIENLHKLKHLTYLNLALNNIEIVENLESCESLAKLDLTLNFVGEIQSVESLSGNYNLQTLFLTGNPCTDYKYYRKYVVATLPQLTSLDGADIERSERILALQELPRSKPSVITDQMSYRRRRADQKTRLARESEQRWKEYETLDEDERNNRYWKEKCEHAPEVRLEMEKYRNMKLRGLEDKKEEEKTPRKMFAPDGRPFNINEPKIPFEFKEESDKLVLELHVYKHMDTSLIEVDVEPLYVRATLRGKILQLALPHEVKTDESTAQRSQTTGYLILTMPRLHVEVDKKKLFLDQQPRQPQPKTHEKEYYSVYNGQSRREFLEIGPALHHQVLDLTCMTRRSTVDYVDPRFLAGGVRQPSDDFIDNPEVPPLE